MEKKVTLADLPWFVELQHSSFIKKLTEHSFHAVIDPLLIFAPESHTPVIFRRRLLCLSLASFLVMSIVAYGSNRSVRSTLSLSEHKTFFTHL